MYAYMALSFFLSPLQQLHSSFCGDFQNGSQEWVFFLHHVEFFSFADEAGFAFYAEAGALVAAVVLCASETAKGAVDFFWRWCAEGFAV